MGHREVYRVLMDQRWTLENLYDFPHAYYQNYAFIYCLDTQLETRDKARIDIALTEYPWDGGYNYVNIYTVFKNQIPPKERPEVVSIQYASPGWIDLLLNPDVALQLAKSVGILLGTLVSAAITYKKLTKILYEISKKRKESRIQDIKLSIIEVREVNKLSQELAKSMGFESLRKLDERTEDAEISAKLLMAHYRRMKTLVDFVKDGKTQLPEKLRNDS